MRYGEVRRGRFLSRPNRFVALAEIDGEACECHVKNTGRCLELLVPGAEAVLERAESPGRRTAWDLVAVYKGRRLVNIDSQAPNAVAAEGIAEILGRRPDSLRREVAHGDSRFDLYAECGGRGTFVEVKGVTLERDGTVLFPDAPTARGAKHLRGLARCVGEGYGAMLVFVVQMSGADHFEPNRATDPAFADALLAARDAGVGISAFGCDVEEGSITLAGPVEVRL